MGRNHHLTKDEWRAVGRGLKAARDHLWQAILCVRKTTTTDHADDLLEAVNQVERVAWHLEAVAAAQHGQALSVAAALAGKEGDGGVPLPDRPDPAVARAAAEMARWEEYNRQCREHWPVDRN